MDPFTDAILAAALGSFSMWLVWNFSGHPGVTGSQAGTYNCGGAR